jgi:hypothetical protein
VLLHYIVLQCHVACSNPEIRCVCLVCMCDLNRDRERSRYGRHTERLKTGTEQKQNGVGSELEKTPVGIPRI